MSDSGYVLIADGEEAFVSGTAVLLRGEGYECDCAPDGATAAEMLCATDYDLLIADIKICRTPALSVLCKLPHVADAIPVIVVTNEPHLDSTVTGLELPLLAYMTKPIEPQRLLEIAKAGVNCQRSYRAVSVANQQLVQWQKDLEAIREHIRLLPAKASPMDLNNFGTLTLRNVFQALFDLEHLTEAMASQQPEVNVCHLMDCPRVAAFAQALRETISVLEATKSAFKSKELGELRKKLEQILADAQGS